MSKHLIDHRSPTNGGKLRAFVSIARRSAAPALLPHREGTAPKTQSSTARIQHFLRIARGYSA